MTITINTPKAVDTVVATAILAPYAARALVQNKIADRKERREEKRYNKRIAKSQAKIGEYKPATIPVQVWA